MASKPHPPEDYELCACLEGYAECDGCAELHRPHCFTAPLSDCCEEVRKSKRILERPSIWYCGTCKPAHDTECSRKKRKLDRRVSCLGCHGSIEANSWSGREFPGDKWVCFGCLGAEPGPVPGCDCSSDYQLCGWRHATAHKHSHMQRFFGCCDEAWSGIELCEKCAEKHDYQCDDETPETAECLICGQGVRPHIWYAESLPGDKWICKKCMKGD